MTTYPEERVLKPLDPVPTDENEWPDFALREVKIFHQGKGRYADILEASSATPLCVLGELMPLEDEQEGLALIENPTYARMKIENVTNYSFGQNDDGKPAMWAAGKAGWYEITPSDRYMSHYLDTSEAIDMFYFMVDQYQKLGPKRKRKGFLIDPFLREYQKHTDYRVDDDDEAMEILHKHHRFLLKQMIEEREDIDWSQTHLWNHLAETYGDVIAELRAKLAEQYNENMNVEDESSSASSENDDEPQQVEEGKVEPEPEAVSEAESSSSAEDTTPIPTKSTDESQSSDSTSEDEEEDDTTDWTKPIWSLLNVLRKSPTFDIKGAGMADVATEIQKMPGFSGSHKSAMAALERFAEPLLRLMDEAKLRKKFNWSTRAIYAELEATLADEVADEIQTPVKKTSNKKHRLKSVLRPSGASKASKRTSTAAPNEIDSDDEAMPDVELVNLDQQNARKPVIANGRRAGSAESVGSHMDSPSRQLNGHYDADALPVLPPAPETQELMDLVKTEAKKHGRVNQVSHLQALLGNFNAQF